PPEATAYLRDIVDLCFSTSFIPSSRKLATIYPIPKPHEWHCYLQNTHPITLLETARKLMCRIMYKRLSSVLTEHNVMTGNNFAGLPGNSVDPPLTLFESILHDAKFNQKSLFVLQQDISKAFDSIDLRMLRLALARLRIPDRFINLILELFKDRYNTI